ncbi:hypothetical protein C8J57DRAFT_1658876 [Mycena rebaudengoi]|nr:hypothetical protein C8J57DRAFT_1658876 [Mycena rebaudengoi]
MARSHNCTPRQLPWGRSLSSFGANVSSADVSRASAWPYALDLAQQRGPGGAEPGRVAPHVGLPDAARARGHAAGEYAVRPFPSFPPFPFAYADDVRHSAPIAVTLVLLSRRSSSTTTPISSAAAKPVDTCRIPKTPPPAPHRSSPSPSLASSTRASGSRATRHRRRRRSLPLQQSQWTPVGSPKRLRQHLIALLPLPLWPPRLVQVNIKVLIDDNDVTIAGHPSEYLKGYNVTKTLEGHGLKVFTVHWGAISSVIVHQGPAAVIAKRVMAPGIEDTQGSPHGHDVIPVKSAIKHLISRGYPDFTQLYAGMKAVDQAYLRIGSTAERGANRVVFGEAVNLVLDGLSKEEAKAKVMVIDSDLEGSTGLKQLQRGGRLWVRAGQVRRVLDVQRVPRDGRVTNSLFADNGLADTHSFLYFPADALQMVAVVKRVFFERGLRFIFSTRSKVPYILKEDGKTKHFSDGYEFVPGKDEVIDAVLRCRQSGLDVGLINKSTPNIVDEQTIGKIGSSPFVLVFETLNQETGLHSKFGTWLLERGLTPRYGDTWGRRGKATGANPATQAIVLKTPVSTSSLFPPPSPPPFVPDATLAPHRILISIFIYFLF